MKKHLHIGVWRSGKVVDDRYLPERGEVTVGSSAKNTFALLGSDLPKEHVLFSFKQQHPILHVTDGMNGEIALDGKARESLGRLQGKGTRSQSGWDLELPESARGWVSVGDAAFFFNIGQKPPPPPRNTLPAAAKTGLFSGLEKTFTAALAAIIVAEGGFVGYVKSRPDIDLDKPSEEDLDRFAEIIMPEKPKEEPKKEEEKKDDDDAKKRAEEEAKKKAEEEAKKKKEEADKKKEEDPAAAAKAEADRKAKLKEAVSKKGLLNVLGAAGAGNGALSNLFASSNGFGDDIGKALAGAGGVKIATGDDAGARKGSAGGGGPVGIGDLGAAAGGGGSNVALGEKKKVAAPQIDFDSGDVDVDSASVDKDSLAKYIRLRIKSVQQCYEKELKLNPSLKGKVIVRFVITTLGRVGDVSIDQNTMGNDNVPACIMRLVKTWSFPMKPEEDSPVSFPFVFSPGG